MLPILIMSTSFQGFVNCAMLWVGVAATMRAFYDINPTAAYMLIPYQCWVTLATFLSFYIWKDNPKKIE